MDIKLNWKEIGTVGEIKNLYKTKQLDINSDKYKILKEDGLYCIYKRYNDNYERIVYLGKASHKNGKALYKRLKAYMNYGKTKPSNSHKGGKDLWEIDGHENFYIKVCKCDDCEEVETELLKSYKALHGDYPQANKRC